MSRASAVAPVSSTGRDDLSDNDLVTRVRLGDDRAFEALFARYRAPVTGYVVGMVKDHARAEDVTQEVFISALRRMRATERPIAFKPWIYEIAKNACIDQYRRSKRGEEISYDVDGGLGPSDQRRLVAVDATPHDQLQAREQLETLCGAFGDLSESHHRILVLRELEGRSYREIGEEMGMSRPAVESTLFRARRRLTEEYSELVSGRRCERIQTIISSHSGGRLGARDEKRMARHMSYCQPCRKHAALAGVEIDVATRRSALARAGAWLFPVPAFLRARRGAGDDSLLSQWSLTFGSHAEPMSSGLAKVAAAAATLAVATFGSGVVSSRGPFAADGTKTTAKPASAQRLVESAARRPATKSTPASARRDDRRLPAGAGGSTVAITAGPQTTTTTPKAGDGSPAAPGGSTTAPAGGNGSDPARAGSPATAPSQDEVLGDVNDTASGGGPRPVEAKPVDTPVGSTPKVTVAPERPAAPAPSAPSAPPVSVDAVSSAPSTVTNAVQANGTGVRVDAGAVSVSAG